MPPSQQPTPMAPDRTSVHIVIVNYRSARLVLACLSSLESERGTFPGCQVVVVDNCSSDDSIETLRTAIEANGWSAWVTLLASPLNGGYAYGNNLAFRQALQTTPPPAFLWLLNPDTIVRPGALPALVAFMRANPRAGIGGSSIEEEDGVLWPYAFRFPSIWNELDTGLRLGLVSKLLANRISRRIMPDHPTRVDWLPGASMIIRREVFETIGLMDEGYFLYFEETDFCLQAQRAGWECWYVPQSRIMHIAGGSTGVTTRTTTPKRRPKYWFDSRRRYFTKNHGRCYAIATDLVWMCAFMLWRLRRLLQRRPDTDPPRMLVDFFRNSSLLNLRIPESMAGKRSADSGFGRQ